LNKDDRVAQFSHQFFSRHDINVSNDDTGTLSNKSTNYSFTYSTRSTRHDCGLAGKSIH
jgi:hypothetical protein